MESIVKTKDVEEAAFYWTLDDKFKLTNIETTEKFGRTFVWFCFSTKLSKQEISVLQDNYNSGNCSVEPRKYSYRRQEIRHIIYDKKSLK